MRVELERGARSLAITTVTAIAAFAGLGIGASGCYQPDVAPCFLACASGGACPDGLACNAQGLCAESATATCSATNTDGGNDAPGTPTTVTVDVVAPDGAALANVHVVFSTPDGTLIVDKVTDASGSVTATVPVGSTASVLRDDAGKHGVSTYLDLWPDAHIRSRFVPPTGNNAMTVNWTAPTTGATAASYSLFTSCFGGNQNTNSTSIGISIAVACPRFDLILIALDSGNAMISYAALGAVANVSNASIVVPANAWREMGAIETMLARVPSAPINLTLQYSAYVTPELAYSTGIVQPSLAQGRANATAFPTALGTTAQIYLTVGFGNDQLQQLYVERLPPNTVSYARDMSTTRIPFPAANIFDAATKKLTWQTAPPEGGVTQLAPDVSYVDLSFRRNGELFEWHIIGRGEHIAPSANSASYVLPPVPPGIAAIVPTASDTITNKTVYYLRAWPSLETEIRSHIESRIVWLDVFDVQGLMAVARAASF